MSMLELFTFSVHLRYLNYKCVNVWWCWNEDVQRTEQVLIELDISAIENYVIIIIIVHMLV